MQCYGVACVFGFCGVFEDGCVVAAQFGAAGTERGG